MTDEEAFAWLRSLVSPNVAVTLVRGPDMQNPDTDVTIILTGATPEQVERVKANVGLRFPWVRCQVRP